MARPGVFRNRALSIVKSFAQRFGHRALATGELQAPMALKPCRECKNEVSTEADTCPKCGVANPTPEAGNRMVRDFFIGLLIVGAAGWGAVRCLSGSNHEPERRLTPVPVVSPNPAWARPDPSPVVPPAPREAEDTSEYVPPPVDRAKAKVVAERILKLVKAGNELEVLRQTDLEACVERMRELMRSTAGLQAEAKAVNGATSYLLGSAAIRLNNCLSCRSNSREWCTRASQEVKEGLEAMRKGQ